MIFDKDFICKLLDNANSSERLRQNYDLRNSAADTSQRMLNALHPGTQVPIHRHTDTAETVICIFGQLEEIFYESTNVNNTEFKEISRFTLCPSKGNYGMQIPAGVWHSINVIEPSVIFEAKDGTYKS
jgi:cupin fold WbuC family metalloprotein